MTHAVPHRNSLLIMLSDELVGSMEDGHEAAIEESTISGMSEDDLQHAPRHIS